MTTKNYIQIASITLLASVIFEITLLAGLASVSDKLYHYLHIFLMLVLIFSQILLYKSLKKNNLMAKYALWFALGMGLTAIGDYVNGANSCVEPVSDKLTWALLLFGAGYVIYNFILWNYTNNIISKKPTTFSKYKYLIDKNLLFVVGSIRNGHLCVKNILPQDVGCGANGRVEGVLRHPFF